MVDKFGFEFLEKRPWTWADAFPWIPGKAAKKVWEHGTWWDMSIEDTDVTTKEATLTNIVTLAIERLRKWTIGEVLPGLPPDLELAKLGLPVRATNVLHREQLLRGADLIDLPIEDLMGCRNAGIGTVTAILRALADASKSPTQATLSSACGEKAEAAEVQDPWLGELLRDLKTLAEWNHSLGAPDRSVLSELPLGVPDQVADTRQRLLALTAADVLTTRIANIADELDAAICGMDERYRVILAQRSFAWDAKTLEELGKELGVTRERARQLEVKARAKLIEFVSGDNAVGRVAGLIRAEIRGVRPLAEIVAKIPALALDVMSVGQPVWRIIDVLDDAYEIADGWCAEPGFEAARRDTAVFLDELADDYGVVRLADVALTDTEAAGTTPWLTDWLEYLGYEVREQFVLLKASSINDLAAAILSIEGAPLTVEALHARVGRGAINSLKNQIYTDPMFTKIDLGHWSLTSWGMEGYTNIRGEIGKLLGQAGDELPLATVVESLVDRFGVSPNSVVVYAGSAPYEVWNGIVRKRTGELAGSGKNPAKVQGYYRRGDDWLYRTTVTHDHLRGSGWPASTALATILGFGPGEYADLPSRLGAQRFSYMGHQPLYGSIKRFVEDMDLGIGDEIFLVFGADGHFDVEQLPEVPDGKLPQALRLVGAEMSLDVAGAIDALGSAIKFAAGADIASIAEGYKARREQQIHDLILGVDPD